MSRTALFREQLDSDPFSQQQCDALFAAVLIHDDLYPAATLPGPIHLDYSPDQFIQSYKICRQLWKTGIDRAQLAHIINKLARDHTLGSDGQLIFKHIRARYKHLHFACMTCDQRHAYPLGLHWITGLMGEVQDAFRNHHPAAVGRFAHLSQIFLMRIPTAIIDREVDTFYPSSTVSFQKHVLDQIARVRSAIATPDMTGRQFHELRKVISRQVAFYDNVKTLYPSPYHDEVSHYFSTVNGLMGSFHDTLIASRIAKTRNYNKDKFAMPGEIRERLTVIVGAYE
jgi:hypothetical protein